MDRDSNQKMTVNLKQGLQRMGESRAACVIDERSKRRKAHNVCIMVVFATMVGHEDQDFKRWEDWLRVELFGIKSRYAGTTEHM